MGASFLPPTWFIQQKEHHWLVDAAQMEMAVTAGKCFKL